MNYVSFSDNHRQELQEAYKMNPGMVDESFDQQHLFPELARLASLIIHELNVSGSTIVKDFPVTGDWEQVSRLFYLFTTFLGVPQAHTQGSNDHVWSIVAQVEGGIDPSRTSNGVPFHTDAAFKPLPEKYFGLLTLMNAEAGGESKIIRKNDLLAYINQLEDGPETIAFLYHHLYPFITPHIFDADRSVSSYTILNESFIRYRYDVIREGLELHGNSIELHHLNKFNNWLRDFGDGTMCKLERGELLFLNNHQCLHARNGFDDRRRHLLRIRFN